MYNSVRWLSRGKALQRFVKLFLIIQNQFKEISDVEWIVRLTFVADFCSHLNHLKVKIQGQGKSIVVTFDIIKALEVNYQGI